MAKKFEEPISRKCYPIRNNGDLEMLNNTIRIGEYAQTQQYARKQN
jgi:hypothetical protein